MLEQIWYELVSRSGGWLAVLAAGALKGAVILAATALVAFALRGASAAVRHQVWLVGVVCALAVPFLGIVLPRFTVPGPALLAERASEPEWVKHAWSVEGEAVPIEVEAGPEWSAAMAQLEAGLAELDGVRDHLEQELVPHVDAVAARVDEIAARAAARAGEAEAVAARAEAAVAALEHSSQRALSRAHSRRAAVAGSAPHVISPPPVAWAVPPVPPTPVVHFPPPGSGPAPWGPLEAGGMPWAIVGIGVWLLGVWLVSAGLVVGAARVAWLGWQAKPVGSGRCATLAKAIADELGLRDVRVLLGASTAMPMTWGLLRPTVLLPAGAESWPVDQLDAVLRHELAHARRRDTLTQLVADIGCAIYWFNPLAWLAAFRLRVEREHACDDEVIASGSKPSDYATQLLDMTRALRAARATAMAAIPMARPSQLRGRLEAVLDEDRPRGGLTRPVQVRAWLLGLLIGVPIAMLGFTPVPSFADEFDFEYEPSFDVEIIPSLVDEAVSQAVVGVIEAYPSARPMPVPSGAWQECARGRRNGSFSRHIDDEKERVEWYTDGCRRTVEIEGAIRFDDEFRRIASLAPGTRIRMEAETRRGERSAEIRDVAGDVVYTFSVNGDERPLDEEARAWIDGMLLELLRTGHAAEERVAALLQQGGVDAVLVEVDHLRTDYVRRIYYQAALAEPGLTDVQAASLIERASAGIRSDYELAELLIAAAGDRPFSGALTDAFLAASTSLSSDYERRRVLAETLARAELTAEQVALVVASAAEIRSDFEKTELLVSLADGVTSSPDVQRAYLDAAGGIGSDHDRRRALEALLVRARLAPDLTALAIRVAAALRSDHDKAETLLSIARTQMLDEDGRAAFLEAIETLRSDYDHGRVSSALLRSGG